MYLDINQILNWIRKFQIIARFRIEIDFILMHVTCDFHTHRKNHFFTKFVYFFKIVLFATLKFLEEMFIWYFATEMIDLIK